MYNSAVFQEDDPDVLRALIGAHPLATLVTAGTGGLMANLIPFIYAANEGQGVLYAHLARANPQIAALREGAQTLVIFQGPNAYITPSWYASKKAHGRVVPTWNYATVQVHGTPRTIEDPGQLRAFLDRLTASQESRRADPWKITDAPEDFVMDSIQNIVGVEIPIARIEGKWKVSQNRPVADQQGVADGLRRENINEEMARLVARRAAADGSSPKS